jgi:D-alanyl-D-alanine carboxypeptidase
LSIAQTLRVMFHAARRDAFRRSLPRAGIDGTLRRHSFGLGDKVVAKTGNINGVYSLSGYLNGEEDTLAFSILLNQCYSKQAAFAFFGSVLRQLARRVGAVERVAAAPRRRSSRRRR